MSNPAQTTPAPPPLTANVLMALLIKQVANLATAMEERSSSKSSMNKPEVFKGKDSAKAHHFMAQFQNWASEQPDLTKSQAKLIKSALGFFTESAGTGQPLICYISVRETPPPPLEEVGTSFSRNLTNISNWWT
ncbi:gag protein [Lentinula edodes]|uniref:Gag protein n=1 Tax=Lentinula edodes TaxID=5353 RepID=A0A1Q3DYN1_LENED|nr:gag protein [Lentinula edodes]